MKSFLKIPKIKSIFKTGEPKNRLNGHREG